MLTQTTQPAVTIVSHDSTSTRYRLTGGTITSAWQARLRAGTEAWCEITVRAGDSRLSSYGGAVWPGAWPELFVSERTWAGPGVRITDTGLALLNAASEAGEPC